MKQVSDAQLREILILFREHRVSLDGATMLYNIVFEEGGSPRHIQKERNIR